MVPQVSKLGFIMTNKVLGSRGGFLEPRLGCKGTGVGRRQFWLDCLSSLDVATAAETRGTGIGAQSCLDKVRV